MKKIAKLGAVLGLVALGGCVGPYDGYETSTTYYGGGYGGAYYDPGPYPYDYYGPGYYSDRPYYGGGGGYRGYNRGGGGDGYRRGGGGRRDGMRGDGGGRRDGQAAQRPPRQTQPQQWQSQPGTSARSQIFGGGNAAPPPAAAPAPAPNPPQGWSGFQGRNPNDPNNTD